MAEIKVGFTRDPVTACGKKGKKKVHDDLYGGVMWIDDGKSPVIVVSVDQGGMNSGATAIAKQQVKNAVGLDPDHIIIFSTHTHSGLHLDPKKLGMQLGKTAKKAQKKAKPALMAAARQNVAWRYAVNRRQYVNPELGTFTITYNRSTEVDVENGVVDARKQIGDFIRTGINTYAPQYCDQELAKPGKLTAAAQRHLDSLPQTLFLDGPVDPYLDVLDFRDTKGKHLGTLVRMAIHPIIFRGSRTNEISADYPGVVTQEVSRKTGAPALFINGPCGNVKPIFTKYGKSEMRRYGKALAREVKAILPKLTAERLEVFDYIRLQDEFKVASDIRGRTEKDYQQALADYEKARAQRRDPAEVKKKVEAFMRVWSACRHEYLKDTITLPFSLVGFNTVPLVCLPGEIFAEHALEVEKHFPDQQVMVGELADGSDPGYVPVKSSFKHGGYEASTAVLVPGSGERMAGNAVKLVKTYYKRHFPSLGMAAESA